VVGVLKAMGGVDRHGCFVWCVCVCVLKHVCVCVCVRACVYVCVRERVCEGAHVRRGMCVCLLASGL
jgi:hypothetical protein